MSFDNINDLTGFANGDEFENELEVIAYFTCENMLHMLGKQGQYGLTQSQLDNFAAIVIKNKWWMK